MTLSANSLVLLNHFKSIGGNETLESEQDDLIQNTFKKILTNGDNYKIVDIENWLDSEQEIHTLVAQRILNIAHYQKAKFDAKNPLKMAHDSCGCGGDC